MRKITITTAILVAALVTGCGSDSGTHQNTELSAAKTTTVFSGGGDVEINDVNVETGGTYISNDDGTVTYSTGNESGNLQNDPSKPETPTKEFDPEAYDPTFNPTECKAAGFFWCPLEKKCLNKPASGSSCTAQGNIKTSIWTY